MKTEKASIICGDRYKFDFDTCSSSKGYAQVDTEQDASYHGIWANPFKMIVVSYVEGDVYTNTAENIDEFIDEINKIKTFTEEYGYAFFGIDPMDKKEIKNKFVEIGLGHLLH